MCAVEIAEPTSVLRFFRQSGGEVLELKLIYSGRLPSNGSVSVKHGIRKQLHPQLKMLWEVKAPHPLYNVLPNLNGPVYGIGGLAERHSLCGFRFVPLVVEDYEANVSTDILFLRRGRPGQVVISGGDIDNRIKTLFDALQKPKNCSEVEGSPSPDEDPFFVLLEDDSMIADIKVTTGLLLTPPGPDEYENDVHLIIGVKVRDRGE